MDESTNLEQLSGPVGAPAPLGQAPITTGGFTPNAQKFAPYLSGANQKSGQQPNLPIAEKSMFPETSGALPVFAQDQIGNVAGVVGSKVEAPPEAEIPTITNSVEGETEMFAKADAGDTYAGKSGREAAKKAKRKDRRADRQKRQDAGLTGGKKRQARRAQRRQRKAAWKDYKAEATLDDADF